MTTPDASPFARELADWGPHGRRRGDVILRNEAEAYCKRLATSHYENFPLVSWLLPPKVHQHFYNVYAFCRWSDDLGDEVGGPEAALPLLSWWRGELRACYADEGTHPVFIALADTIRTFSIPPEPFEDLISAFEQDQCVREYDSYPQLLDYCRRSANPVGHLVLLLAERATPQRLAWSDSICTALQLANFWQDVARDHAIGRIYLPREDYQQFGVTRADFEHRRTTPEFRELLAFEVARTRQLFEDGLPLVHEMPGRWQIDIDLFARGGMTILDKIERLDYGVWETRPKVHKRDAIGMLGGAMLRAIGRACGLSSRPSGRLEVKSSAAGVPVSGPSR